MFKLETFKSIKFYNKLTNKKIQWVNNTTRLLNLNIALKTTITTRSTNGAGLLYPITHNLITLSLDLHITLILHNRDSLITLMVGLLLTTSISDKLDLHKDLQLKVVRIGDPRIAKIIKSEKEVKFKFNKEHLLIHLDPRGPMKSINLLNQINK